LTDKTRTLQEYLTMFYCFTVVTASTSATKGSFNYSGAPGTD